MNQVIVYIDGLGTAAIFFSLFIVVFRWKRTHWFDGVFVVLLVSMMLFFLGNFFEWMGLFTFFDPYESFLLPLTWSFFFFANINKIKISELKRAQDSLKESENKSRILLENFPQKIFLRDRQSVYVSCNEKYARDLNIAPEEITGKTDSADFCNYL
jgi:PAS domain-containing protein